jgi:SAM-dependent MidA family methyltransferase
VSAAAQKIAEEIGKKGALTFAEFMELALYCPNCGYYEKEEDIIGHQGDYYTSAAVGRLFGELLALQFAAWLEESHPSHINGPIQDADADRIQIVEAGAHGGRLAGDILSWMRRQRPALFERLRYWIVEPSARRREWQRRNLAEFSGKVHWVGDMAALRPVSGIIFSNELLDSMPIHRLGWDAKQRAWFEWGVTIEAGAFAWTRVDAEGTAKRGAALLEGFPQLSNKLLEVLPDGFSLEVCPAATRWWRQAAESLESGKLVTLDYGLTADDLLMPERKGGTLRAYYQHRRSGEVLERPGEQDITAHVNFTAIRAAGEAAGLKTEAFQTQAQFLTGIASRMWQGEGAGGEPWTPERTRQFQTLTHPEHLGRPFRALVQSRSRSQPGDCNS